jgi:hypothetical protein
MKINRLPGTRGTFTAKTAKKTRMYSYQVNGTEQDKQAYMAAKESEGYPAVIDAEYGVLYFTSRNLGIEADLSVYTNNEGNTVIAARNQGLADAEEKQGILSDATVDALKLKALESGSYAKKVAVTVNTGGESNLGEL